MAEVQGEIVLINGSKEPRSRSSESVTVLDCGCAHTPTMWLQMCRLHYTEDRAIHDAALVVHAACATGAPLSHVPAAREAAIDPLLE